MKTSIIHPLSFFVIFILLMFVAVLMAIEHKFIASALFFLCAFVFDYSHEVLEGGKDK